MDFYIVLGRPGYNVRYRKRKRGRVGAPHRVTRDEAMKWFQQKVSYIACADCVLFLILLLVSMMVYCWQARRKNEAEQLAAILIQYSNGVIDVWME